MNRLSFQLVQVIQEEHRPAAVYCVRFCECLPSYWSHFATVGANSASVYLLSGQDVVHFRQSFVDEDSEECFYSCCWSSSEDGDPLLVVSGFRGILKVINCVTFELQVTLLGHGNAVNDLRTHPINDQLVFSASKDESIRLWNIKSAVCIAIFAGEKGHHDEVLSIDINPIGNCFLSTGMDTSINIWNLVDPHVSAAIDCSHDYTLEEKKPFKTVTQQIPLFSTHQVHCDNYVDSARWFGNFIVSKSTKNRMILWAPDSTRYKDAPILLRQFLSTDNELWFVRLDVCVPLDLVAVGNRSGKVFIFSLSGPVVELPPEGQAGDGALVEETTEAAGGAEVKASSSSKKSKASSGAATAPSASAGPAAATGGLVDFEHAEEADAILSHPKCRSTVRQVAFSPDASSIVYSCDDGSVWVWTITTQ